MTAGHGAGVIFDYVGERGAEDAVWQMTRPGGSHYLIGYGGTVEVPYDRSHLHRANVIGNLVGTYNDLAKFMVLTAQGKLPFHTSFYPLDAVKVAARKYKTPDVRHRLAYFGRMSVWERENTHR